MQPLTSNRSETDQPVSAGQWCAPVWVHVVVRCGDTADQGLDGYAFHCRWVLPALRDRAQRAEGFHAKHAADADGFRFETDPGTIWLPCGGRLELCGGRGLWSAEVWACEDPVGPAIAQELWLTRNQSTGPIVMPERHTRFRLLAGSLAVAGTAAGSGAEFPAAAATPGATTAAGWIQTGLLL